MATIKDDEATRLYAALSDLVHVYQFRDRDRICCHDISVTQCYAMETLVRLGSRTLNELATEMYLDKSTTSRVVATLERKGYVERLQARIERDLVEETRRLLQEFEPAVRQAAPALLTRLARAAERRSGCAPTSRACCS